MQLKTKMSTDILPIRISLEFLHSVLYILLLFVFQLVKVISELANWYYFTRYFFFLRIEQYYCKIFRIFSFRFFCILKLENFEISLPLISII